MLSRAVHGSERLWNALTVEERPFNGRVNRPESDRTLAPDLFRYRTGMRTKSANCSSGAAGSAPIS